MMSEAEFFRCSITDRCLTIQGDTLIYGTACKFDALPKEYILPSSWSVSETQRIKNCDCEIYQIVSQVDEEGNVPQECHLVIKPNSASRKCPLLGLKGQRDIIQLIHISAEIFLIQLATDLATDQEYYWTLMNLNGRVLDFPNELKTQLSDQVWNEKMTLQTKDDCYRVILVNAKKQGKSFQTLLLNFNLDGSLISCDQEELLDVGTSHQILAD